MKQVNENEREEQIFLQAAIHVERERGREQREERESRASEADKSLLDALQNNPKVHFQDDVMEYKVIFV